MFARTAGGRKRRYVFTSPPSDPVTMLADAGAIALAGGEYSSDEGAPELPRETVDTTYSLPTGGTTWTPVDSAAFQTALDDCEPGDVIVLDKDTTYSGNFTLTTKAESEDWVYVISSALASLPEGTRVGLSDAAYMPTVAQNNSSLGVLTTLEKAVAKYRFAGLNFTTSQATTRLINTGYYSTTGSLWDMDPCTTTADLPHDITFDRCIVQSTSDANRLRHGLVFHGVRMAVVDSYVCNCKDTADAMAIFTFNAGGPYKIHNCFLEATGENVIFGGTLVKIPGEVPSDVTISHCYFYKREVWKDPDLWAVKNLFEIKNVRRLHMYGCVLENSWSDAQSGYGMLIKIAPQGAGAPQTCCQDVLIENCVQRNTKIAVSFQTDDGSHPADTMERVTIRNCWFQEVSRAATKTGVEGSNNKLLNITAPTNSGLLGAGNGRPGYHIRVDHSTWMYDLTDTGNDGAGWFFLGNDRTTIVGGYYTNNLAGHGLYRPDTAYLVNFTIEDNLLVFNPLSSRHSTNWSSFDAAFPSNTKTLLADVGFEDASGNDFRLAAGSSFKGGAAGGTDFGVDYAELTGVLDDYDNAGLFPF